MEPDKLSNILGKNQSDQNEKNLAVKRAQNTQFAAKYIANPSTP